MRNYLIISIKRFWQGSYSPRAPSKASLTEEDIKIIPMPTHPVVSLGGERAPWLFFLFLFWGERGDYSLIRECGSRDECRSVVIMMLKVMVIVMVSVVILGRVIIMMGMMMVLDDGNNYYINDRMITISMAMITILMVLRITIWININIITILQMILI